MSIQQSLPLALVDSSSVEYRTALDALREVMLRCGFHVHKRAPQYATLQAYLGKGKAFKYPLLNPRFDLEALEHRTNADRLEVVTVPMIIITMLARGEVTDAERAVASFPASAACFCRIPASNAASDGDYRLVAEFGLPLQLIEVDGRTLYNLDAVEPTLRGLHQHLC